LRSNSAESVWQGFSDEPGHIQLQSWANTKYCYWRFQPSTHFSNTTPWIYSICSNLHLMPFVSWIASATNRNFQHRLRNQSFYCYAITWIPNQSIYVCFERRNVIRTVRCFVVPRFSSQVYTNSSRLNSNAPYWSVQASRWSDILEAQKLS
jgi:hypothetical protein